MRSSAFLLRPITRVSSLNALLLIVGKRTQWHQIPKVRSDFTHTIPNILLFHSTPSYRASHDEPTPLSAASMPTLIAALANDTQLQNSLMALISSNQAVLASLEDLTKALVSKGFNPASISASSSATSMMKLMMDSEVRGKMMELDQVIKAEKLFETRQGQEFLVTLRNSGSMGGAFRKLKGLFGQ